MRALFLSMLLLTLSCSSVPDRSPATVDNDFYFAEVVGSKSSVKQFPPEIRDGIFLHYFYLELKDAKGEFVDSDVEQIELIDKDGRQVEYAFKRLLRGRYYLIVESNESDQARELDFVVNGQRLREKFHLFFKKVDQRRSWIREHKREGHHLTLRLYLADRDGKPVQIPTTPEILVEGNSYVTSLEHVGEGLWEFELDLPEENAIIYLTVRAHGNLLERLFRLQHIEK